MWRPRVYLRLLLRSWKGWPLLEKLKLGAQYVGVCATVAGLTVGLARLTESPAPAAESSRARASLIERIAGEERAELDESDRMRFDELETDEATMRQLRSLLREDETLPAAREILERLRRTATTRPHKHAIDGFITSTYYEVGEHLAGLEFLAGATRDVPLDDFRYRWQFHAHIRAIASTKGRDEAERVVETFLRRTGRPELSPVWIGVPRRLMDDLRAGATAHDRKLEDEDAVYLRRLAQTHAADPFIDHAHYALGAYDTVLADYPHSLLRDAALRAALYRAVTCADDPRRCDLRTAQRHLAELHEEFPELAYTAANKAGHLLAKAGRLADADRFACPDNACGPDERVQMLDSALRSGHVMFGEIVAWLSPRDAELLEENIEQSFLQSDESLDLAGDADYAGALALLEEYERKLKRLRIDPPDVLVERMDEYRDLARRPRPRTAEEYFRYGLAEMDIARRTRTTTMGTLFRRKAVETFRRAEAVGPATEWAPKSCYLRASALRKLHAYDDANEVAEHFLQKHRGSPLYDDMMAEKGWYLLRVRYSPELAAEVLEEVARRFPDGNAADNALTMLADSKWEECRFSEALDVYHRIIDRYPKSRLGLQAQLSARHLASIVRTRRVVPGIRGLRVEAGAGGRPSVVSVALNTSARRDGFLPRDTIRMIGDTHVGTVASYHAAMAAQQPGSTILVRVETPAAPSRFLRVRVQTVEAYDPERISSDCRL